MATFEPYAEGHFQSAAQVAKSAHDLFMTPMAAQPVAMPAQTPNTQNIMPAQGGMPAQQSAEGMAGAQSMCRISTRNLLRGRVISVTPGAVNSIVVVTIGGGQTLTAVVTLDSLRDLGLRVGSQVTVAINPNDVLLIG